MVVIGSGVGGLCCAAVCAWQGFNVCVVESHTIAGGCAHSFERNGFTFDSGPSFYAGLQDPKGTSGNALKQVLDLVGEDLPCASYDRWTCHFPGEGARMTIRANREDYRAAIAGWAGPAAVREWDALEAEMAPLARFAAAAPFGAMRSDALAGVTMARYGRELLGAGVLQRYGPATGGLLNGPFSALVDKHVRDPKLRNLIDLECFVLSGMLAKETLTPEMVFMYNERNKPGAVLDYPLGGSQAYIDALVRGIRRRGGRVCLGQHVEALVVEGGRCVGAKLRGRAEVLRPRVATVSNASVWDTQRLLPPGSVPEARRREAEALPKLDSFMHLHLGIDAEGLPPSEDLGIHHLVVNDWARGVDATRNVINISIPSCLDPSLAPAGAHTVHVYTAANEPWAPWEGLDRRSAEYAALKEERSQVLWEALENVIPDVRRRERVRLVGTPLTHRRFLRREQGTYGAALVAGKQAWPTAKTALPGLLACGDSTFPGIGVPAAAGSGLIAANTLCSLPKHLAMLDALDALRDASLRAAGADKAAGQ